MTAFFLQQLINGLTLGAVYGLIAIGYTMVYGIIGMINFAHGEVYMISAYLSAIALALLAFFGLQNFPLLILGTLLFTVLVTCTYGWVIERIAYKPLRNSTRLAPLISAIGMSLILQNYVQLSQGPNQQGIPTLLSGALRMTVGDGVVQITWTKVFILVAALVGMLILTWIIQYTRLGRICRATQQDRRMAAILGFKEGARRADPVILEPVMHVEVETPEEYAGNIMGDLSSRRGMVQGMEERFGSQIIRADVPLAEMFGYSTTLRSMSQGRATYTMEFHHFAEAPRNVADEIIAKRVKS